MKVDIGPYEDGRHIQVEVEPHDTWNLDQTLALIIHPSLLKMKEEKNSYPGDLQTYSEWEVILDKMILSFERIKTLFEDEPEGFSTNEEYTKYYDEIREGLNLFSKYYLNLWV